MTGVVVGACVLVTFVLGVESAGKENNTRRVLNLSTNETLSIRNVKMIKR